MDDLSLQGIAHFNAGRFAQAQACFHAAIASGDRRPETACFLAHVLDASSRIKEAAAQFASTLKRHPGHRPAYDGLAGLILRRGALPGAGAALRGALALKAGRRDLIATLRLCASAWRALGDFDSADAALTKALKLAPGDAAGRRLLLELLRERSQAALAAGLLESAEKTLRRAFALAPRDAATRILLLDVLRRRAQERFAAGDLDASEAILKQSLRLAPGDRTTRARLVETLGQRFHALRSAGRRREASALSRRILKLSPRDAHAAASRAEAVVARAVRLDRGGLSPRERFRALMKLGRHAEAIAVAEALLDAGPALADLRAFWDPWEWDERLPRAARRAEYEKLSRALAANPASPWLRYYRTDLAGPDGSGEDEAPAKRYGWMNAKFALAALLASRFGRAERLFRLALEHEPVDWRARAFLAEAYLCLRRTKDAYAEMDRALRKAPANEKGQVLAWRGAFDLWLGRYKEALPRLEEACRLDAQCAFCWKGAALLLLGKPKEALKQLDLTLKRYPLDFEARLWRGETKRVLGFHKEALQDLARVPQAVGTWALFNRALSKAALGDRPGMNADFDAIPQFIITHIHKKTRLTDREAVLQAGIKLSRGFRREEYRQAFWLKA